MADAVTQREQQIVRLAYQDSLTGLPNRTALLYLQHPVAEGYNALLLMDLARLTAINETLGFATGDTLIKELAARSQAVLQAAMAPSVACSGHSVDLAICCGLAGGETQDAVAANALLRNAEVALHSAKRAALDHTWYSAAQVDRSFVDGIDRAPGTQKLVRAMIEMGHGMDLMVTAEGVETEAERSTLAALGCDVMQGYLRSRSLHGAALQD